MAASPDSQVTHYGPARSVLVRTLAPALAVVLLAAGCTVAEPDPDAYRARTTLVLTDAISHVSTAQTVLEASRDDRILGSYALTTVRSSDDTLNTAVGAYFELYPPPEMDSQFQQVSTLLGDATDLVTQSRIALYRQDHADYPGLISDLDDLTTKLERLEKELS
jgi:hypothetical protein